MPRKPQFTVTDIIDTALQLVRKSGWAGLSVATVAEKLGSSTMPIYSHFKNMGKLQDEVVKIAWKLIMQYESKPYTGDAWIDQGVGYVRFANEEKNLFICMFDGRNLKLQRKMLRKHWEYLAGLLNGYKGFSRIDPEQELRIRYSRGMLSHGVAMSIVMGWCFLLKDDQTPDEHDEILTNYLTTASYALLNGYQETITPNHGENLNMEKP